MPLHVLFLGILLFSRGLISAPLPQRLIFLNNPETIRKPGLVGRDVFGPITKARFFFHYRNATGKSQLFHLGISGAVAQFRRAAIVGADPCDAGFQAARKFQAATPTPSVKNPAIDYQVPPAATISGMCEGIVGAGAEWRCRFGRGPLIRGATILSEPSIVFRHSVEVSRSHPSRLRICDERQVIPGGYGRTYQVAVHSVGSGMLTVVISPRGGGLRFVAYIGGRLVSTGHIAARSTYALSPLPVTAGSSLLISMIPTGGYNYPLELHFRISPPSISGVRKLIKRHEKI